MAAACCHHDMLDRLKAQCAPFKTSHADPSECETSIDLAKNVHHSVPQSAAPSPSENCRPSPFMHMVPCMHACKLACMRSHSSSDGFALVLCYNDPRSSFEHACTDTGVVSSSHTQQKRIGCTRVRTWAPLGNRCQVRLPSDFKSVVLDHSTIQPKDDRSVILYNKYTQFAVTQLWIAAAVICGI